MTTATTPVTTPPRRKDTEVTRWHTVTRALNDITEDLIDRIETSNDTPNRTRMRLELLRVRHRFCKQQRTRV